MTESQELIKAEVQSLEQKEIEKLESDLIKKKQRVATCKQKIEFKIQNGNATSKWTGEFNKADFEVQDIVNRIKLLKKIEDDKITEALLKDYEEDDKIFKEKRELAKERTKALALFKEYPTITIPIKEKKEKPDFSKIGDKLIDQNMNVIKRAEYLYNTALKASHKASPVGTGNRTTNLLKTREEYDKALFDVNHEPILCDFRELLSEKKYNDTVINSYEAELEEVQAIISKVEEDLALFEKHGLIKPKT